MAGDGWRTYEASALLICAADCEIEQARRIWILFELCPSAMPTVNRSVLRDENGVGASFGGQGRAFCVC